MKVVNAICWIVVNILGFAIDRGWELWLNVRSKLCVKPSEVGGLYTQLTSYIQPQFQTTIDCKTQDLNNNPTNRANDLHVSFGFFKRYLF